MSMSGHSRADADAGSVARYIIDPSGTTWDVDQLATHHDASPASIFAPDHTLLEALVMDKGYAGLRITAAGCHVLFNPSKMLPATLTALRLTISNQSPNVIMSSCFQEQWSHKVHVSTTDILDYVTRLAEREQGPDCLMYRELSQTALNRTNTPQLAQSMRLIVDAGAQLKPDLLAKLALLTQQRFVVCSWQSGGHLWRVERSGTGYGKLLNLSPRQFVGNQPAYNYGCWVHDRYSQVMANADPVVDDVDAIVFIPGVGRRRLKYRRILAPMVDENGCDVILSMSVRDESVDLGADDSRV